MVSGRDGLAELCCVVLDIGSHTFLAFDWGLPLFEVSQVRYVEQKYQIRLAARILTSSLRGTFSRINSKFKIGHRRRNT